MPYHIDDANPECSGYAVVKDADGSVMGCHETKAEAAAQLAALYAKEPSRGAPMLIEAHPPAEGIRAMRAGPDFIEEDDGPVLFGHFAVFNQWTEIDSLREGHFLERIMPGAFKKTFAENANRLRVLFQHGKDPTIGDQSIAVPREVGEDEIGAFYRAPLLDGVPPLVVSGLRAGQYGSSFRFTVIRGRDPVPAKRDAHGNFPSYNPTGLPERTIREAQVMEFGPVTWPAYAGATAMVRSMTDEFEPDTSYIEPVAPSADAGAEPHLVPERRETPVDTTEPKQQEKTMPDIGAYPTRDEKVARVDEIEREMETLDKQFDGVMPDEPQARWDGYIEEKKLLLAAIDAVDVRKRELRDRFERQPVREREEGSFTPPNIVKQRDLASIYDVQRTMREARSVQDASSTLRDNAMRAVEHAHFPTTERAKGQGEIESLLNGIDKVNPTEAAKRVLYTGSPAYRRGYYKYLTQSAAGPMFTSEEGAAFEEARTALVTAANTAVPFDLDPTMVINTSGAINPFRQAFRVVKTTSNDWRPSVSSGMTAVYEDEATAATDLSPSFTAPARLLVKAHTAATFSVEIQGDYALGSLEAEIAKEIADAKDVLEATQFSTGAGTTHFPDGIFTYFTANFLDTATTLVIVAADLYKLEANIGPRYRGNTVWLGSPYFYSLVRGIDTAGGSALWIDNLQVANYGSMGNNGRLATLIGHPAYECIAPANASMATTEKVAILADRDRFVIIDRIGMNVELIPNFLDATTGYPTGQRMIYAWWRNTSVGIGLATLGAGRAACIFRGK